MDAIKSDNPKKLKQNSLFRYIYELIYFTKSSNFSSD